MQPPPAFILSLAACALVTGCAGVSPTRIIDNTGGAAGGAILGHTLGKGDALTAALGAGAGVLLSEGLQTAGSSAQQKSYVAGYEKGQSDAVKQQFQALNERQRFAPDLDDAAHAAVRGPLPERQINGITSPSTATRIQDNQITMKTIFALPMHDRHGAVCLGAVCRHQSCFRPAPECTSDIAKWVESINNRAAKLSTNAAASADSGVCEGVR